MSSTSLVRFAALRDRFVSDRGTDAHSVNALVIARLERALDAIGWRSANGASSDEVAAEAVHIIAECVNLHHDVTRAADALADLLYRSAATLDGSMYAPSAFLPAAEEVLGRYSRD